MADNSMAAIRAGRFLKLARISGRLTSVFRAAFRAAAVAAGLNAAAAAVFLAAALMRDGE